MRVNKEKEKMAYFMIIKQNCFVKKTLTVSEFKLLLKSLRFEARNGKRELDKNSMSLSILASVQDIPSTSVRVDL